MLGLIVTTTTTTWLKKITFPKLSSMWQEELEITRVSHNVIKNNLKNKKTKGARGMLQQSLATMEKTGFLK